MDEAKTPFSTQPDPALLAQAEGLDDKAIAAGEATEEGRRLRAQAAGLRLKALGERIYPAAACRECFEITGWLSADGRCDACLRRAQLQAAYRDPHGGFVSVADERPRPAPTTRQSPRLRLGAIRHPHEAHERALVEAWMTHVRPDETGPIEPEDGYQVELAKRDEVEALDGSAMIIRFHTVTAEFGNGNWNECETTRIARRAIPIPAEFPASLPVEQLVEAWGDYQEWVDGFNRDSWAAKSAERERQRQARQAQSEALLEQRNAIDLLDEH